MRFERVATIDTFGFLRLNAANAFFASSLVELGRLPDHHLALRPDRRRHDLGPIVLAPNRSMTLMPGRSPRNCSTSAGLRASSSLTLSAERPARRRRRRHWRAARARPATAEGAERDQEQSGELERAHGSCPPLDLRTLIIAGGATPAQPLFACAAQGISTSVRRSLFSGDFNGHDRRIASRPQSVRAQILLAHGAVPGRPRLPRLRAELLSAGHRPRPIRGPTRPCRPRSSCTARSSPCGWRADRRADPADLARASTRSTCGSARLTMLLAMLMIP